jgi:mannose-6-phosphate isomerase-like protein (cupin superfamily)
VVQRKRYTIQIKEGIDYRELGGLVKRIIHPETVGSKNLAVAIMWLNPGEQMKRHKNSYEEAWFVMQGEGKLEIEGQSSMKLEKNLFVYIPMSLEHSVENTGNEQLVLLVCVSPPVRDKDITVAK